MRDMSPSTAKRSHMSTKTPKTIEADVLAWLDQVVIGLNLCPFAARPRRLGQIRVVVSNARDDDGLIDELAREGALLLEQASEIIETSLLVVPDMLEDFEPYNHFVAVAEMLVRQYGWEGQLQIASFHPNYCFDGAEPEDDENLTNRSPYPILHLIREESIERALSGFPNPERIPERNVGRVCSLSAIEKRRLFPYLFRA